MIRVIIASLWLAFTFWANAPDAAAQEAASQQQQEYRIIPIQWGDTVSQMCQRIPRVERGDTIYGCAYKALADSGIENDRKIPVGMQIYLPVAPGYGSAQAETQSEDSPQGFITSTPPREISSPASQEAASRQGTAVGIMIIGGLALLALVVIIAVAMMARRKRKESEMNNPQRQHQNGQGGPHQPGGRMRDMLSRERSQGQGGQQGQRAQSDREDEEEAPASTSSASGGQSASQQNQDGGQRGQRQRTKRTAKEAMQAMLRNAETVLAEIAEDEGKIAELEELLQARDEEIDRLRERNKTLETKNQEQAADLRTAQGRLAAVDAYQGRMAALTREGSNQDSDQRGEQRPQ